MPSRAPRQSVRPAANNRTELTDAAARVGHAIAERDPRCDAYFLEPADLVTAGDLRATWQLATYGQVAFAMLADALGYGDKQPPCTPRTFEAVLLDALERIECQPCRPLPPCTKPCRTPQPEPSWAGTVGRVRHQLEARRGVRATARRRA